MIGFERTDVKPAAQALVKYTVKVIPIEKCLLAHDRQESIIDLHVLIKRILI